MGQIEYVSHIILVLLYALRDTIWSQLEVSFLGWFKPYIMYANRRNSECIFFFLLLSEALRYLSMYDNRCLRYFKGHKERFVVIDMMLSKYIKKEV